MKYGQIYYQIVTEKNFFEKSQKTYKISRVNYFSKKLLFS